MFWYLFGFSFSDEFVSDHALEGPQVFSALLKRARGKKMLLSLGHIHLIHEWIKWEKRAVDRGLRPVSAEGYLDHYYANGHKLERREEGEEPIYHALNFCEKHRLWDPDPHLNPEQVSPGEPVEGVLVKRF